MTVEVPLTRGYVALVDDEDAERVMVHSWRVVPNKPTPPNTLYAGTGLNTLLMHRLILGLAKGQMADHRDGNGLNNCKANLRICSVSQNMRNRSSRNSTGFKGVAYVSHTAKFKARIHLPGKCIHLGCFQTAEDAARAYDFAAIRLHGEFARLNFPSKHNVVARPSVAALLLSGDAVGALDALADAQRRPEMP